MKILQINTVFKEKSTGRNCFEINAALANYGHQGYTAYGRGNHNDKNAYRIGTELEYYFHNIMARVTGFQGYFSIFATYRLLKYIKKIKPDIIHLQNIHAFYLNYSLLFRFIAKSNIPVVLHLHDCWAFTGKCAHYTNRKCYKWKNECFSCPAIHEYPKSYFFDTTTKMFNDKKRLFNSIPNLTVIGVSKWISNQAKESFLSNRKIEWVYNWVDTSIFYPRLEAIHDKYNIKKNKFTVLGVSSDWIKNSPKLNDFLKLSNLIEDDIQIVLVGKSEGINFPKNITHIPFVKNVDELAKIYSISDSYVHLSTEDTFGKVVAEAMACGIPAIVYNSTALPELLCENCGFVVESRNIEDVYNAIKRVKSKGKSYYSDNCIENVKNKFYYEINTKKMIEIYQKILSG